MTGALDPVVVVALFGAGVAGFLSPCVLPLVPAYLAMVGGEVGAPRPRLVAGALGLVSGFTAVVALFGAGAAAVGGLFQDPATARVAGGVLTAIAGATLVVARLRPSVGPLSRTRGLLSRVPGEGSWWRPMALGAAFALMWTPCVGPLLGAALGPAVGSGSPLAGAALLAAYAAGLGVPFVVMSLVLEALPGAQTRLRRFGPPAGLVAGMALVVLGILLATGATDSVVPDTVARAVT